VAQSGQCYGNGEKSEKNITEGCWGCAFNRRRALLILSPADNFSGLEKVPNNVPTFFTLAFNFLLFCFRTPGERNWRKRDDASHRRDIRGRRICIV